MPTNDQQQDDITPPNQNLRQSTAEWVPRTNYLDEKAAGPALVYSSQDVPDTDGDKVPEWVDVNVVPPTENRHQSNDEEQGGFMDMTLVSAHLVESERGITIDNSAAQIISNQQQHVRLLSKRVAWAIVALIIAAVVSLTCTIIFTAHEAPELAGSNEDSDTNSEDSILLVGSNDDVTREYEAEDTNEVLASSTPFREEPDVSSTANPGKDAAILSNSSPSIYADTEPTNTSNSNSDDETSLDYSLEEKTRIWKSWNVDNHYLFDPDATKNHITSAGSPLSDTGQLSYTEMSLMINGGLETYHCYHQ
jgi:hypothetical protein